MPGKHVRTFDAMMGSSPGMECASPLKASDPKFQDLLRADYIFIDEASMMKGRQLNFLHQFLCRVMGRGYADTPFAGKSIILVMDLYQLPPVDNRNRVPDAIFHSYMWEEFWLAELTELVRQSGDIRYAQLLRRLRKGEHTEADIVLLRTRAVEGEDYDWTALPTDVPVIAPTNEKVDVINNTRLCRF